MKFPILLSVILFTGFGFISDVSGQEDTPLLKFSVLEGGNKSCILAEFSGEIVINQNQHLILNGSKADLSHCGTTTQLLQINLMGIGLPKLSFIFDKMGNNTLLTSVLFTVNNTDYKSNASNPVYTLPTGNTWKCNAGLKVDLMTTPASTTKMELSLKSVRLNAFRMVGGADFEKESTCSADSSSNKTVPMIIAFVLAGMVIIMLVGYVILRRREDKSVYQTV